MRAGGKQGCHVLGRQGMAEKKTLGCCAAPVAEHGTLVNVFNPFCHCLQMHAVGHGDDRLYNGTVFMTAGQVVDKGTVDLETVNRKMFQVTER